jgi:hypothetical protein
VGDKRGEQGGGGKGEKKGLRDREEGELVYVGGSRNFYNHFTYTSKYVLVMTSQQMNCLLRVWLKW